MNRIGRLLVCFSTTAEKRAFLPLHYDGFIQSTMWKDRVVNLHRFITVNTFGFQEHLKGGKESHDVFQSIPIILSAAFYQSIPLIQILFIAWFILVQFKYFV
mmetsp:Transcript_25073/g.56594  ORF Transcript_25073/g.56594 Transcript_25073/m.56594 type:complete len:102 (-) Transcript_25073:330-635(-)